MTRFLLVCLGGAIGSGARYLVSMIAIPYGTPVVNLLGSFLIGVAIEAMRPSDLRLFIATGILGGFTTYSAFNHETIAYARAGELGAVVLNVGVTVVGCLVMGLLGVWVGRGMR